MVSDEAWVKWVLGIKRTVLTSGQPRFTYVLDVGPKLDEPLPILGALFTACMRTTCTVRIQLEAAEFPKDYDW